MNGGIDCIYARRRGNGVRCFYFNRERQLSFNPLSWFKPKEPGCIGYSLCRVREPCRGPRVSIASTLEHKDAPR